MPFALSISNEIKSLGAYAGFAAVVGLALLALLYFAQARELRRLTEWAGRAPERGVPPPAPVAVPQPRPGGPLAASPSVRPLGPARPQPAPGQGAAPLPPGTPLPVPGLGGAAAATGPFGTSALPTATTPAGGAPPSPQLPNAPRFPPGPASPPGGLGPPPPGSPAQPSYPADQPAAVRLPGAAFPGGVPGTRAQPLAGPPAVSRPALPPPPPPPPRRPPAPEPQAERPASGGGFSRPRGRRTRPASGRTLGVVAGAFVVLVLLVFAVTHLLGGGGSSGASTTTTSHHTNSVPPGVASQTPSAPSSTVAPSTVTVAVLNASGVSGLAKQISARLVGGGYVKGYIGNAADQSEATTAVQYAPGEQAAAKQIAGTLGLAGSTVAPLQASTTAVNPTVSDAQVVVLVGTDLQQ